MKRNKLKRAVMSCLIGGFSAVLLCGIGLITGNADYRTASNSDYRIEKEFNLGTSRNGKYADFGNVYFQNSDFGFYGDGSDFTSGWLYESTGFDVQIPLVDDMVGNFSIVCQPLQENYNSTLDYSINSLEGLDYDVLTLIFKDLHDTNNVLTFSLNESGWFTANVHLNYKGKDFYANNYFGWSFGGKGNYNTNNTAISFDFDGLKEAYKTSFLSNLTGFEEYSVSLSMGQNGAKNVSATKKLLVYELCGQNLGANTLTNSCGPIYSYSLTNGIVGKKYNMPKIDKVYDAIDGIITNPIVNITVKDKNQSNVEVFENSLIPTVSGNHTVTVQVKDKAGYVSERTFDFNVFGSYPEVEFEFDKEYSQEYSTDTPLRILLPTKSYSAVSEKNIGYSIELYRDDTKLKSFTKTDANLTYPLTQEGKYTVKYITEKEYSYNTTKEVEFSVVKKPYVKALENEIVGVGSTVSPEWIYSTYNGQKKLMDMQITDPNGQRVALNSDDSFIADVLGDYEIKYSVDFGGVKASQTQIVSCMVIASSVFQPISDIDEMICNQDTTLYSIAGNGLEIYSSAGGQISSNIFDLSKHDTFDIIKFQAVNRENLGTMVDFSVYLVDANDSSNYVAISYWQSPWAVNVVYATYWYKSKNNEDIGLNPNSTYTENMYGSNYTGRNILKSNGGYLGSADYGYSFKGGMLEMAPLVFSFDAKTGTFYSGDTPYFSISDGDCVGYNNLWKGFSSDFVYVSLRFGSDDGGSCAVNVLEFLGQSLSGEEIKDKDAPIITIDKNEYIKDETRLPKGEVGSSYNIPSYEEYDYFAGVKSSTVKVVNVSTGMFVQVKNGAFTPTVAGEYEIEYKVTDKLGNIAKKLLKVDVIEKGEITADWAATPQTAYTGSDYAVPKINVESTLGALAIEEKITVGGQSVDNQKRRILLKSLSDILIDIKATDYVGNVYTHTFKIDVVPTALPVLFIGKDVPTSALVGEELRLPEFEAIDYNYPASSQSYYPTKWITVGGVKCTTTNVVITSQMVENNAVAVQYFAGEGDKIVSSKKYVIPVINPQYIGDYFIYDNGVSYSLERTATVFTATQDGGFSVANNLSVEKLIFKFAIVADNAPKTFSILLTDFKDETNSVKLTFVPLNNKTSQMYINDGETAYAVKGSFYDDQEYFYVYYNQASNIMADISGNLIAALTTNMNGEAFDGFDSNSVRIKFTLECNDGKDARVRIYQISNQTIVNTYKNKEFIKFVDNKSPVLAFSRNISNTAYSINESFELPEVFAYDFCSKATKIYTTLISPGKIKLIDNVENASGRYTLSEYGTYSIIYTITEGANTYKSELYFDVVDEIKPKITLQNNSGITVKANQGFVIPTATFGDDETTAKAYVLLYNDAHVICVNMGDTVTLKKKGTYQLRYFVIDDNYNSVEAFIDVVVK